jgi:hypothetical protein
MNKRGAIMSTYYEFEVVVCDIKPAPKRRFLIHQSANFEQLHQAIQDAFEWYGGHLWSFGTSRRNPDDLADCTGEYAPYPQDVSLASYFGHAGQLAKKACYVYDFGDNWEHVITLKRVVQREPTHWRLLLSGANPAPPEDCGSTPGMERLLAIAATGKDPWGERNKKEAKELLDYYNFDGKFDLEGKQQMFDSPLDDKTRKKLLKLEKSKPEKSVKLTQEEQMSEHLYLKAAHFKTILNDYLSANTSASPKKLQVFDILEPLIIDTNESPETTNMNLCLGLSAWIYLLRADAERGGVLKDRKPEILAGGFLYLLDMLFVGECSFNALATELGVSGLSIKSAYTDLRSLADHISLDSPEPLMIFSAEVQEELPEHLRKNLASPYEDLHQRPSPDDSLTNGPLGEIDHLRVKILEAMLNDSNKAPPEFYELINRLGGVLNPALVAQVLLQGAPEPALLDASIPPQKPKKKTKKKS